MTSGRVYTAIFGGFDTLRTPKQWSSGWDYICLCNPLLTVPAPWQPVLKPIVDTNRKSARHYKILSHVTFPNTELTIWHGGNVRLLTEPKVLLDALGNTDIAVLRHSDRSSVYDEAKACMGWKLDNPNTIKAQMDRYRALGFSGRPLSAAFLIVRRNTGRIRALNEMWWGEVSQYSIRDQLSFDYCCWKLGIEPAIIPGNIFRGPSFQRFPVHG